MYSASSPGPSPMWYCRSPTGIAIRRSEGVSTRLSAFGKTSPSLRWLLRWRETRARIVRGFCERQARSRTLDARTAPVQPCSAPVRRPGRPSGGRARPPMEARRVATRVASSRRAWRRRTVAARTDSTPTPVNPRRPAPAPGRSPGSWPNPATWRSGAERSPVVSMAAAPSALLSGSGRTSHDILSSIMDRVARGARSGVKLPAMTVMGYSTGFFIADLRRIEALVH